MTKISVWGVDGATGSFPAAADRGQPSWGEPQPYQPEYGAPDSTGGWAEQGGQEQW
jgi:hypothetical protein